MAVVVTRKHWLPLGVLSAIYFVWLNRVMSLSGVPPNSNLVRPLDRVFFLVVILGAIGCAFFAPTVVVKRKHWIVFAVLSPMQVFGIMVTMSRAGTHMTAFLWLLIPIATVCYSFMVTLIIVQIVGVVAPRRK